MSLAKPNAADATQEYRGPIVEVVTDVSVELLPDESVDMKPMPSLVRRAMAHASSIAPIAVDVRSPDASLEFPHPVSPELFADDTSELLANDSGAVLLTHEPPQWRLPLFASVMVLAAILVGIALGQRAGSSDDALLAAAETRLPKMEPKRALEPEPTPAPMPAKAPEPSTGTISSPKWAKGRRVLVDGRDVGTSGALETACGKHVVKIGPAGKAREITIPCGGTITVLP